MTTLTTDAEPVVINMSYSALPKQAEFHGSNAKYRFFGGGFGNGKTSAGVAEALALSIEYPGTVGVIMRKTRPELLATTMLTFWEGGGGDPDSGDFTGCPQELVKSHNKSQSKIELINGSIIYYWPLDDAKKLTNINLGWFLIDQAEEIGEEMFLMLKGRLRRKRSPRKGMLLFNPNGHDWIWKYCVNLKMPDHELIHAKTTDNPNLPADYIEQLMNYPEAWRRRFMDGSFDVFTGQIWPEFDPDVHLVNPRPLETWWEVIEGIDHGRRNPTAVLWAAFDDKGNCFIVDEHYQAGQRVGIHAQKILDNRELLGITPNYTVIDASASQKDPNTERSVIDEYWDYGITTIPSDRHKIARVNRVAEWLRLDPNHPHPFTGETRPEGWPRLYIYKNCHNLAEHVPQYQWKPQPPNASENPTEEPMKKDDHDVDALGYILMTRPMPSERPVAYTDGDARSRRYWDRKSQRGPKGSHSMLGSEA
jgi:phage terminase large subunit